MNSKIIYLLSSVTYLSWTQVFLSMFAVTNENSRLLGLPRVPVPRY